MKIQTVFLVAGQTYAVDGTGQDAASAALQQFKNTVVKLHGFMVNGNFKPADLTSYWQRNQLRKH
jgi:hypothetical protein